MAVFSHITVKVPATTANLGPGFDCIGAALKLYNEFEFTTLDVNGLMIQVSGMEAEKVQTDESNLLYQAFVKLYQHIEQTAPSVKIRIKLGVPLSRGLGSSATAIVGGLVAANELAGRPLSELEVMKLAIAMEGHPDNVVPALLGGCRLAATSHNCWEIGDIPWHRDIVPVVAIPDFELSTSQARKVLPAEISRDDAIFNISHFGLLLRGLATNREEWLKAALQDKLHQPYRQALIPGYDAVNNAAIDAGAYGMVISGAGPTLLALVDISMAKLVEVAMKNAWLQTGITSTVGIFNLDMQGTTTF
ncbi:homoserine kinase [Dolichospermum circinale]|uniref:homoserine kinase n=1 Tax=Dolichospermum circinale TaxID=109265 RepID=UPI00232BB1EC|nr:homoserine kinase [Dolichospermum circinale]MDB9453652.1 homoserine kinase [Dolichospermum circinale CS-541/06]MDB9462690.1 homoserine kinase [Dolichospermum circinale CS-541/04]MDB9549059.1 homoserine kinase [Dolichospermum circinale CS-1031]